MIPENTRNIKVHFAGAEGALRQRLFKASGINYALATAFPFISGTLGIKTGYQIDTTGGEMLQYQDENFKHTILDSGLFSLMFGSYKGAITNDKLSKYFDTYIRLIVDSGYKGSCVELDVQKTLGVEQAWNYRKELRNAIPNRIVNVVHLEDGKNGLDRILEQSDYIAISIPELRANKKSNKAIQLYKYILANSTADLHLLGCTENKLLRQMNLATSSDSTSWTSFNKFGVFRYNNRSKTTIIKKSNINYTSLLNQFGAKIDKISEEKNVSFTDSMRKYIACDLLQIKYLLKQYSFYAGEQ